MSADLDNFFARKDKKKQGKKIKDKFKIEVVENEGDYDENGKAHEYTYNENGHNKKEESDNEWIEEEPIEVDFTSLNIQTMDINELNALLEKNLEMHNAIDNSEKPEYDDGNAEICDDHNSKGVENSGGWKLNEKSKKKIIEEVQPVEPLVPEKKKTFIPPHLRKEFAKNKAKHYVNNEEEFPSLLK